MKERVKMFEMNAKIISVSDISGPSALLSINLMYAVK